MHIDVFSFAAAMTALLIAAGLMTAFAVNRTLSAFPWWAGAFVLLALSLVTATLRLPLPPFWAKGVSYASLYAAAAVIALRLCREGPGGRLPVVRTVIGAVLFAGIAATLIVMHAPPPLWFLYGPAPTLVFMACSAVVVMRAGLPPAHARAYALVLVAGMAVIATRAVWYATDLMRAHPLHLPAMRAAFAPPGPAAGFPGAPHAPTVAPPVDFVPPFRQPPPVEQPLTIALLTIAALLGLAAVLVLRDFLASVRRMQERSTTDAMTGLLNRATFDERAAALLEADGAQPVCMVLLDVDHFKRVNDTCGHPAGDKVIAALGRILGNATDTRFIAGRFGGEEFAVLLPGSNPGAARLFAEAVRSNLSITDFGAEIPWTVTLSAGVAMRHDGESLRSLISRTDKALYEAKRDGRNRVVMAHDPRAFASAGPAPQISGAAAG